MDTVGSFHVDHISAATVFSPPMGFSLHGGLYASLIMPLPVEDACDLANDIFKALDKYGGYHYFAQGGDLKDGQRAEMFLNKLIDRSSTTEYVYHNLQYRAAVAGFRCRRTLALGNTIDELDYHYVPLTEPNEHGKYNIHISQRERLHQTPKEADDFGPSTVRRGKRSTRRMRPKKKSALQSWQEPRPQSPSPAAEAWKTVVEHLNPVDAVGIPVTQLLFDINSRKKRDLEAVSQAPPPPYGMPPPQHSDAHIIERREAVTLVLWSAIFAASVVVSLVTHFLQQETEERHKKAVAAGLTQLANSQYYNGANLVELEAIVKSAITHFELENDHTRFQEHTNMMLTMLEKFLDNASTYLGHTTTGTFPIKALVDSNLEHVARVITDEAAKHGATPIAKFGADLGAGSGTFVRTKKGFDLMLNVPLATDDTLATVYRVINAATQLPNGETVRIDINQYQFFAITANHEHWIPMSSADLLKCKPISGTFICDHMAVMRRKPTPQHINRMNEADEGMCLYGLFIKDMDIIKATCRLTKLTSLNLMEQINESEVIVATTDAAAKIRQICANPKYNTQAFLSATNKVSVRQGCSLETEYHVFQPPTQTDKIPFKTNAIKDWPAAIADGLGDQIQYRADQFITASNIKKEDFPGGIPTYEDINERINQAIRNATRQNEINKKVKDDITGRFTEYAHNHTLAVINSFILGIIIVGTAIYFGGKHVWNKFKLFLCRVTAAKQPHNSNKTRPDYGNINTETHTVNSQQATAPSIAMLALPAPPSTPGAIGGRLALPAPATANISRNNEDYFNSAQFKSLGLRN